MFVFQDRNDAGRRLADMLERYADREDVLVLALPRGGVPVGCEVARALRVPMDVFLVRKLGVPGYEELAMGAITTGGVRVMNEEVVRSFGISEEAVNVVVLREQEEMKRRELEYRRGRPEPDVKGKIVILVDDGLATGASMKVAVLALKKKDPHRIVVAVPTGAKETCHDLAHLADEVISFITPEPFFSVGSWYRDFAQTSDEEVRELLEQMHQEVPSRK